MTDRFNCTAMTPEQRILLGPDWVWAMLEKPTKNPRIQIAVQTGGDFCTSIGKDCYALFLFLGKKNDKGNIYGVLSNNFEAAIGKCNKIDRAFIENFFKGSRYLHTPPGMMQAIVTKKEGDSLTLMVKFS
ncbi:hypothetical protein KUCAC02_021815 [Chaenocephalus aceratus]|uniref:Uncharacterized protein n=1 Tax=Chaenocephalus aceratus TaxID=36190 RepID=A0ACB9XGK8_CHAAC|nr:hypothetical protein KUCAC02_021815 [Chaenocephalus aceratus]